MHNRSLAKEIGFHFSLPCQETMKVVKTYSKARLLNFVGFRRYLVEEFCIFFKKHQLAVFIRDCVSS